MEFTKERNFIVAYDDNGIMCGKWNISTGDFIGKSNKPVKNIPSAFTYNNLTRDNLFAQAIYFYRNCCEGLYSTERAQRFEAMLSVGIFPNNRSELDSTTKLTKDLVAYIKTNCNGIYTTRAVKEYTFFKKNNIPADFPSWATQIIKNLALQDNSLPFDYVIAIVQRLVNEHANSINDGTDDYNCYYGQVDLAKMVAHYYKMNMAMYNKVQIPHNFLSACAQTMYLYKQYMQENYDKILAKNNDKPFLYFQSGEYEARPILSRKDFHNEAEAQHNCVERIYMNRVLDGNTYIVTVRRIDAPDIPLITCEVSLSGEIVQYLGCCNRNVTNPAQKQFYKEFQNHLKSLCE